VALRLYPVVPNFRNALLLDGRQSPPDCMSSKSNV